MKASWGKVRIGVLAAVGAAAFAAITVATVTLSHAQLAASPWPMFHHDLRHTGLSGVDTSGNPGAQKWKFATGSVVKSSPALGTDGTIYVGSFDGNVYALNPEGGLKWKYAVGAFVWSSPAVGADGTIYIGSEGLGDEGGNFYALNPDGSLKWEFALGPEDEVLSSSPAVGTDGTIYFLSSDGYVDALNPNGTMKWYLNEWEVPVPGPATITGGFSSPAVGADGTILCRLELLGRLRAQPQRQPKVDLRHRGYRVVLADGGGGRDDLHRLD